MQPAIPVKGPYIKIIHRCERQKRYGGWTPAFRLFINDGNSLRLLPGFSARSPLLTLPTRAAAEWWGERQARAVVQKKLSRMASAVEQDRPQPWSLAARRIESVAIKAG